MTINKAIEILGEIDAWGFGKGEKDSFQAIQLGIEALKDLKLQRQYPISLARPDLPGETN